jgi:UDP-glucoronosyl and UDP-glucosyl transferase
MGILLSGSERINEGIFRSRHSASVRIDQKHQPGNSQHALQSQFPTAFCSRRGGSGRHADKKEFRAPSKSMTMNIFCQDSSFTQIFKDMQDYLDGAKDGVIYFSMGSILKAKDMDSEKVRAFADAFAELPQRVVWKWEAETMPGQPKNVKIGAWMPQQAILGNPSIKVDLCA